MASQRPDLATSRHPQPAARAPPACQLAQAVRDRDDAIAVHAAALEVIEHPGANLSAPAAGALALQFLQDLQFDEFNYYTQGGGIVVFRPTDPPVGPRDFMLDAVRVVLIRSQQIIDSANARIAALEERMRRLQESRGRRVVP